MTSQKKMPGVRDLLKRVGCMRSAARFLRYAGARYVMERKFRSCRVTGRLEEVRLPREPGRSSFFGYYNISPFSLDNRLAVWGETSASGVRGALEAPLDIVVCDLAAGRGKTVARTSAWNWQQGAMTQWLGRSSDTIVFNDYCPEADGYCSRIVNIATGAERRIDAPFYSWSHDGGFFLTLNFKRLKAMRPDYAYFNHRSDALPPDAADGIWRVDAATGAQRLLVPLEQLRGFQPTASMDGAMHKVNHIDISPDDRRFIFLHRWVGPAGRRMRLFSADAATGELFLLNGDLMTSHSCWYGRDRIISFCHTDEFGDAYAVFRDGTPERTLLSPNLPHSDGHPSISPDGKWVVADTYPGFARFSKLMLFRLAEPELITAGEFFQPLCFDGEKRIDLHPKWDRKTEYIGIDSGHTGRRQFHIFRLDGLK